VTSKEVAQHDGIGWEAVKSRTRRNVKSVNASFRFDHKMIDAIVAGLDQRGRPGAVLGIAVGGRPLYREGFGLANMELPLVLSTSTRMRVMSVTKQFASLAYLLLCESGRATPDDLVGKYLPGLHPVTRNVSVRQLMGNISGLRDVLDLSWHFSGTGHPISTTELLSLYEELDQVNAAPGTAWIYNNGGWLLLGAIIERIAERSIEDVLRERIFEPLGMYDSLLRRTDTDFVRNCAHSHLLNPDGQYEKAGFGTALSCEGGVVSTVDDLLRWLKHMSAPIVGTAETWHALRQPQQLANGSYTGYGLGLVVGRYRGVEVLYHSGVGMGCSAHVLKVPAFDLDVVVISNRDGVFAPELAERILDVCLQLQAAGPPGMDAPLCSGIFRSPQTGRVIQLFVREGGQTASIDGFELPLELGEGGILRPTGASRHLKLSVTVEADPRASQTIRISDFGNTDELIRLSPSQATDGSEIAGHYKSTETQIEAVVSNGRNPALKTRGRFGAAQFDLQPLAEGIWRARSGGSIPWGGILSFASDATSFAFSNSCTRMLKFVRYS